MPIWMEGVLNRKYPKWREVERNDDGSASLARAEVRQLPGAFGDPFRAIGADTDRRVQLALGSAGVPESFIIDGRGVIRHQHIGVINPADVPAIVAAYEAAR